MGHAIRVHCLVAQPDRAECKMYARTVGSQFPWMSDPISHWLYTFLGYFTASPSAVHSAYLVALDPSINHIIPVLHVIMYHGRFYGKSHMYSTTSTGLLVL